MEIIGQIPFKAAQLSSLTDACLNSLYFALIVYMYIHLLEVPKQHACTKCLHTVLLLRNFQQNSFSGQIGQHSHMHTSCNPGRALQLLHTYVLCTRTCTLYPYTIPTLYMCT